MRDGLTRILVSIALFSWLSRNSTYKFKPKRLEVLQDSLTMGSETVKAYQSSEYLALLTEFTFEVGLRRFQYQVFFAALAVLPSRACPSQVPKPIPTSLRHIYLLHFHRTAIPQICNHNPTRLTPSLSARVKGDLSTSPPSGVMVWIALRHDHGRDHPVLLLKRQHKLAPPAQEKLFLLDHQIPPVVVPICNTAFDAGTFAAIVLNGLGICECCF